jgi:hypothetical protein
MRGLHRTWRFPYNFLPDFPAVRPFPGTVHGQQAAAVDSPA